MRRQIVTLTATICGLLMIVDYYFQAAVFKTMAQEVRAWTVIISAFAIGLGGVNLVRVHSSNIKTEKGQGAVFSITLLIALVGTIFLGLSIGADADLYVFIWDNIAVACGSTMSSMLAFYLGSASFRAFRARNVEAALLLASAILVMLGAVPVGEMISPHFPTLGSWIMDIPNTAGQRGIMICSALGYVSISLRTLFGLERAFGGVEAGGGA